MLHLQLEDELSKINLPCKVHQSLVDELYEDINHGSQHQDDDSLTGPFRSKTESRDTKKSVSNKRGSIRSKNSEAKVEVMPARAVTVQIWGVNPLTWTKKKSLRRITISTSLLQINQSINLDQSSNRSPKHRSNINSPEQDFNSNFNVDEIGEGELTQILQDEEETITDDQVTSAASQEIEQRGIEPKTQKKIKKDQDWGSHKRQHCQQQQVHQGQETEDQAE